MHGEGEGDDVAVLQRYVDVGGSAVQPVDDGAGELRHEPVLEGAGVILPAGDDASFQGVGHDGDVLAGDELCGTGGVVWVAVGDDEGLDGVEGEAHRLEAAEDERGAAPHAGVYEERLAGGGEHGDPGAKGSELEDAFCDADRVAELHWPASPGGDVRWLRPTGLRWSWGWTS